MLTTLTLKRYRVFEDTTVELGPLTAFVGPNASGKSSILRACTGGHFYPRDVRSMSGEAQIVWNDGQPTASRVRFSAATSEQGHLSPRGAVLHLQVRELKSRRAVEEGPALSPGGENLVNVLHTISRRERERLAQEFVRLVPVFADVDVRPAGSQLAIVFQDRWSRDVWYQASEVSDGTMFALSLLALAYQARPTALVAIEEPEHGLHPYLLSSIVDVLRALPTRKDRPIQVVLATQSSELLDLLRPEEVRFLTRKSDGSVTVFAADTESPAWREAYQAHQESLSSLWLSGSAGGVP